MAADSTPGATVVLDAMATVVAPGTWPLSVSVKSTVGAAGIRAPDGSVNAALVGCPDPGKMMTLVSSSLSSAPLAASNRATMYTRQAALNPTGISWRGS